MASYSTFLHYFSFVATVLLGYPKVNIAIASKVALVLSTQFSVFVLVCETSDWIYKVGQKKKF